MELRLLINWPYKNRDNPEFSRWVQYGNNGPLHVEEESTKLESEIGRAGCFEGGRKSQEIRNAGNLEQHKRQGNRLFPKNFEKEYGPANTLILA